MPNEVKLSDVAESVFGITPRWYRLLAKEGKVPQVENGKIDFVDAVRGLIKYYRDLSEGKGAPSLTDHRARLVSTQAELKMIDLKIRQGELIQREEVLAAFLMRINFVKTGLMTLHRVMPGKLKGKDARQMGPIIKKYTMNLLDRFSRKGGVLK